ncbi:MAG: hypothetical protein R3F20_15350 [Planctomycetota bacterium]
MNSRLTTYFLCACVALAFGATSASAQVLFFEKFDNNAAGWSMTGDWAIGATSVGTTVAINCGLPDPDFDASGDLNGGVAGAGLGASIDGDNVYGPVFLTSPAINAHGQAKLMLEFQRWLNADYDPYMASTVEVFDGCNWVLLVNYGSGGSPTQINDSSWVTVQFDITAYANKDLRVRFGYQVFTIGAYDDCAGWNVDNVKILNQGALYERFDDNSNGWSLGGDWVIGAATAGGNGSGQGFPDPDRDGDTVLAGGVAGVVLGGDPFPAITPIKCIESPAVDTTGMASPNLGFDRFLSSDYLPFMQSSIEVWDGASWVQIWETGSAGMVLADSAWTHQNFDLSAYSNAALKVRFCYVIGDDGVYNISSWNIDNVVIFDTQDTVPAGQASTVFGSLDINFGAAQSRFGSPVNSGDIGPYYATVFPGSNLVVNAHGQANGQPWVLLLGDLNPGVNPIAPFGQLDIGTPGLGGITVVGSGLDAGFQNAFYFTNNFGDGLVAWGVPAYLAGATFTMQGIMVDPAVTIAPTNAVKICIGS